jgi:hypothetical protein
VADRGQFRGKVLYRKCNKVTELENGKDVTYDEGTYYEAEKAQKLSLWDDGYTVCYKRGNMNYLDISDSR